METHRIQSVLASSLSTIQSAESFSDRMRIVYNILNKEFPKHLDPVIACASTDGFLDCISRVQIDLLLDAIKKSSETGQKYLLSDKELNKTLSIIYDIID